MRAKHKASITLLAACLCCGCAADGAEPMPAEPRLAPPPFVVPEDYEGPPLRARFVGQELEVTVTAPIRGGELTLRETTSDGDDTRVDLCLALPAAGPLSTPEETLVKIFLPQKPGAVRVYLQSVQDGVHYLVEPEFALAATVPRR